VLTAAHCLESSTANNYRVIVGMLNLFGPPTEFEQTIYVSKIYIHESFLIDMTSSHDIAVITLATSAILNKNVQLARIAENVKQYYYRDCQISGWGYISYNGPVSNILQKALTKIVDIIVCSQKYQKNKVAIEQANYICVYDYTGSPPSSTCLGDSGSPLLCGPEKNELVGILQSGQSRCEADSPSMYVNLSLYRDWLADKL
ncbi:fibrinolytic enzyme, isozyme C, partial [Biomphalaria glabrata]